MLSMWAKLRSENESCSNDLSRDFIHLSQVMGYGAESVKYELAVILEKCLDNKTYKDDAVMNLISLAKSDSRIKTDLEDIADSQDPSCEKIGIIAKEIINRTPQHSRACK